MAKVTLSTKRLQIDKANARMIATIAVASFVTIFSLVACRALLSQRAYQSRVISGKEKAKKQLVANVKAVDSLVTSYKAFVGSSSNVLGGSPDGQGDRDGDNARIVLDALPSKYDFPALTTSLEKLLTDRNFKINSISGTDDEVAQAANEESTTPKPVDMPFQFSVTGNYKAMQDLMSVFERSIRPFQVQSLSISGSDANMQMEIGAKTFYQPEKKLSITTEDVR